MVCLQSDHVHVDPDPKTVHVIAKRYKVFVFMGACEKVKIIKANPGLSVTAGQRAEQTKDWQHL